MKISLIYDENNVKVDVVLVVLMLSTLQHRMLYILPGAVDG